MSGMKDWKTYAIVALALWCAWLTWKASQPATLDPEAVWDAYATAKKSGPTPPPVRVNLPKHGGLLK